MKVPVALRLDEELVARIDAVRGDVPRVRWFVAAAEEKLGVGQGGGAQSGRLPVREPSCPPAELPAIDGVKPASELFASAPPNRCPVSGCGFRAPSPRAACFTHGRMVVPL